MNEALCGILCGEDIWCFDEGGLWIKFLQDGTGELSCRVEFCIWILAEIEWRSIKWEGGPQAIDISATKNPRHLGQLRLEITLTKRRPPWAQDMLEGSARVNEHCLTDDAFRPKTYTVEFERGNFREPAYTEQSTRTRFALRLLFDKSPYPLPSEWKKQPKAGPDLAVFSDIVEFVGRRDLELKRKGRAMNDPPRGWSSNYIVS